jgi:hypothetical protein
VNVCLGPASQKGETNQQMNEWMVSGNQGKGRQETNKKNANPGDFSNKVESNEIFAKTSTPMQNKKLFPTRIENVFLGSMNTSKEENLPFQIHITTTISLNFCTD